MNALKFVGWMIKDAFTSPATLGTIAIQAFVIGWGLIVIGLVVHSIYRKVVR